VSETVRRRMETTLASILAEPEVRTRVEAQGMDVLATSGESFAAFYDNEIERWGRVVRDNGIRADS
jgi:tripartite-type tricarboxylate transporter receptor subunit TctC